MKRKEFDEIKQKPIAEMEHELHKFEARVRVLRTEILTGKVKSLKEMHEIKKSVAQMKTVLSKNEAGFAQTK